MLAFRLGKPGAVQDHGIQSVRRPGGDNKGMIDQTVKQPQDPEHVQAVFYRLLTQLAVAGQ